MDEKSKATILGRTAVPSRLKALERAGIPFEALPGNGGYSVAGGAYLYFPMIGNWRSRDHKEGGYTTAGLIQAIEEAELRGMIPVSSRGIPEKPAAGRDSVAKTVDPDRTADLTIDSAGSAESAAGPKTPALKTVWP